MNWFSELLTEPSVLQAVIYLSLICSLGLALGQIKIKGVSLGVTLVFFAGILLGHISDRTGLRLDPQMVSLAQNFGLILFVYTLGIQVGPGFFTSLRQGGVRLNVLGIIGLVATTGTALAFMAFKSVSLSDAMGLLCGATTNTPALGAAQQALLDAHPDRISSANDMATACAVGYPLGVLGVLLCLIILKGIYGRKALMTPKDQTVNTFVAEFHVSNPAIFDKSVHDIAMLSHLKFIITRVWRDGKVTIPHGDTQIRKDDHLLLVSHKEDVAALNILFGDKEKTDWNRQDIDWDAIDNSHLVSKHILVTRKEMNGVKLGSLHLRNQFDINITRLNRAGIDIVASPSMRLQQGDRLTVVGEEDAIRKVGEILGNEEKVLYAPNLIAIFIGLCLGTILGAIPLAIPGMSTPLKLGIAGGPIIVGILMGAFGPRIHLATYTTRSANMMLRQFGIVVYLACLGYSAGGGFFETVFCLKGLAWVGISLAVAILPTLLCGLVAKKYFKLDFAQNAGMLCAMMANPIALNYASSIIDNEEPAEAYATVYPISMFLRVLLAQLIMLAI